MSRWGSFPWGDGTLYGATPGITLVWGVEVDWDGDGAFNGSNESDRLIGVQTFRGRQSYLSTGEGFSPIQTGSAQITLKNDDGRYDPWNTASPLYPNVVDGRDVRLRVLDTSTGLLSNLFYGVITDIQASNYKDTPTVVLQVEDGWRTLRRTTARVDVHQNISPETAIGLVLDAAKWPARWGRSLNTSPDNIRYFWSSGGIMASSILEDLANSFLGYFFIDATGVARYVSRSNTTGSMADLYQDILLKDLNIAQPWENRRNITRVKVHPLTTAVNQTLWSLVGSVPAIVSGVPLTLWANYDYGGVQVPGINVVTPVPTTDYTANTAADGSGTNKTGQVSLAFSNLGDTAKLVFSYSGGGTVYLTSAKVRGDAVYEISVTDVTYPVDTSVVTNPREFLLDLPWQQDLNSALDFAGVLGPFLELSHPFPQVKIDSRPDVQFIPDLFDLVSLDMPRLGIGGVSFRVAGISNQSTGNCQHIVTTYWLEPYVTGSSRWIWPITNFGTDTVFGW